MLNSIKGGMTPNFIHTMSTVKKSARHKSDVKKLNRRSRTLLSLSAQQRWFFGKTQLSPTEINRPDAFSLIYQSEIGRSHFL